MNGILKKTFGWMSIGLLVTFLTAYVSAVNVNIAYSISRMYLILALVELGLVIFLSARITKMSPTTARIVFLLYSFVTGLTFASIFLYYEMASIILVFLMTAIMFGVFALIGYTTNLDLNKIGTYLLVGLISIIICSIINIFIGGNTFGIIISIISIIIFLGYTAYDIQKIKELENYMDEENLAIFGALQLYLDFINIFIDLLRIFGSRRD
jgi:FtsH-binding integral membrane protein